jgi:hypothetical protein
MNLVLVRAAIFSFIMMHVRKLIIGRIVVKSSQLVIDPHPALDLPSHVPQSDLAYWLFDRGFTAYRPSIPIRSPQPRHS